MRVFNKDVKLKWNNSTLDNPRELQTDRYTNTQMSLNTNSSPLITVINHNKRSVKYYS